jgi:hypothetical protein
VLRDIELGFAFERMGSDSAAKAEEMKVCSTAS